MVSDLIWALAFFGFQEIWAPKSLVPKKFGPFIELPYYDFNAGSKFFRTQISRGPKKVRGPNEIMDHFSYSLFKGCLEAAVPKAELLQLNRTQFSSLGIFISKKVGNRKN